MPPFESQLVQVLEGKNTGPQTLSKRFIYEIVWLWEYLLKVFFLLRSYFSLFLIWQMSFLINWNHRNSSNCSRVTVIHAHSWQHKSWRKSPLSIRSFPLHDVHIGIVNGLAMKKTAMNFQDLSWVISEWIVTTILTPFQSCHYDMALSGATWFW